MEGRVGRTATRGFALLAALSFVGFGLSHLALATLPEWPAAFIALFAIQERGVFLTAGILGAALAIMAARGALAGTGSWNPRWPKTSVALLACVAGSVALCGRYAVYHDHPLSVDEVMTRFGATILLEGQLLARLPEGWSAFAHPLQPIFTFVVPGHGMWGSAYRPVNAALHAGALMLAGVDALTNAVMTAAAIPLAAAIAWQLWPTRDDAAVLTAVLVAASPQVLVTGMTLYAMPGHLALNLAWLWLFLGGGRARHAVAGLVGVLAVGLHQVNFHLLFVLPVIVYLVTVRRWKLAFFYLVVYAAATSVWLNWFEIAVWWSNAPVDRGDHAAIPSFVRGVGAAFSLPDPAAVFTMAVNVLRFVSWNHLALVPLGVFGCAALRRAPVLFACACGAGLTVIAFLLVLPGQGHGWGYRYLHGYIGIAALVGALGWITVTEPRSRTFGLMRLAVSALTVATLVVLLARLVQVEAFVRPRAHALAILRAVPADVVIVDDGEVWYGQDLAQNDPYLRNSPKIMVLGALTRDQIHALCAGHLRVARLGHEALAPRDVAGLFWPTRPRTDRHGELRDALRQCGGA